MYRASSFILFLPALVLFSCSPGTREKASLFTILDKSYTGVGFRNELTETEDFNMIQYLYFNNGGGVAAGDINNDGLTDLYFTSNQGSNRLYLNRGNLRFEDITGSSGTAGTGNWKTGVSMADINGDGLLDIYVCQVGNYKTFNGRNQLFINQGDLTFRDEAKEYRLDFSGLSTQAAFLDYDLDGDLDMYLLNHSVHRPAGYGPAELRHTHDELSGDRLFRNDMADGKCRFTDVTAASGIYSSMIGYGLGVSVSDFNDDGYPDIYVSNDFHENDYLYMNMKDGTFTESLAASMGHTSRSSMGNDAADINNDGLTDMIVLDMLPDKETIRQSSGGDDDYQLSEIREDFGYHPQFVRNTLQLNLGGTLFSEIGLFAGIHATDWSWSPLACDFNNDGWKDIFITSGIFRRANDLDYVRFLTGGNRLMPSRDNSNLKDEELYKRMPLHPNSNYFFRNNGDLTFSNENDSWDSGPQSYSNGSAFADLDNDGDMDLAVSNINAEAFIYRNNCEKYNNHYVSFRLKGRVPNSFSIGARITIYTSSLKQVAEAFVSRGFLSSVPPDIHFGTGKYAIIDSAIIRWPDLSVSRFVNIKADTTITLYFEEVEKKQQTAAEIHRNGLFSIAAIEGFDFTHREDAYSELLRESLTPHSLAAEGPALAAGDINGDGLDDVFAGGAAGQESVVLVQEHDGNFKRLRIPRLAIELDSEDVDAVFFDADSDGDDDLYIVRGGNQLKPGNLLLNDLLLINSGSGKFTRKELPAISHNGSCVRPADFDGDGDIDLFVGSRSLPSAYGLNPENYLLENDGKGNFRNVTAERMNAIRDQGMVTDAAWIDIDKDGDKDLAVTGEWMKIMLLENRQGYFRDVSDTAIPFRTEGFWHSIEAADLDNDGDFDLVAGNLGCNTILRASPENPVRLYLNDFDNNGQMDPVICRSIGDRFMPVASLDEFTAQISGFVANFPSYSDFAGKDVFGIFGNEIMEQSLMKEAVLSESCIFRNSGNGTFAAESLPSEVQFSVIRDIRAADFNSDGYMDIILTGNDYNVRPAYGRHDASYGWFLEGGENNRFKVRYPAESGLIIKGDSRRIVSLRIAGKPFLAEASNRGQLKLFRINAGQASGSKF